MVKKAGARLAQIIAHAERDILNDWLAALKAGGTLLSGRVKEAELQTQCRTLLGRIREALEDSDTVEPDGDRFSSVREQLAELSRARALQGFSPTDTAMFVFSLKQAVFGAIQKALSDEPRAAAGVIWDATELLDRLGLVTLEHYQKTREEVIARQQREISELSTPVVKLWDGILALPLIGTLDSERTQVVMENLLQSVVDHGSEIAIIDITGVPTVDTLVAQHLLKTIAAARLMGADCIISGIRPQIAQTMVHLGVDLKVVSKATLADAFALALQKTGRMVAPRRPAAAAE